jgi:hypothetical protein
MGVESKFHYVVVFLLYGTQMTSEKFPIIKWVLSVGTKRLTHFLELHTATYRTIRP